MSAEEQLERELSLAKDEINSWAARADRLEAELASVKQKHEEANPVKLSPGSIALLRMDIRSLIQECCTKKGGTIDSTTETILGRIQNALSMGVEPKTDSFWQQIAATAETKLDAARAQFTSNPSELPYHEAEHGGDSTYTRLVGPRGFDCILTEPEDRCWYRDLKPVVDRLNELEKQLAEAKKSARTCESPRDAAYKILVTCGVHAASVHADAIAAAIAARDS